jgi:hypothetical protein
MGRITRADAIRLFGPLADHTVAALLRSGADGDDLRAAAMRLAQNDIAAELRLPLSGAAARVYDIVTRDPLYLPDDRERG